MKYGTQMKLERKYYEAFAPIDEFERRARYCLTDDPDQLDKELELLENVREAILAYAAFCEGVDEEEAV